MWGSQGAPPKGIVDGNCVWHRVDCNGYEESDSRGLLHVVESWTGWPFGSTGLPFERADPTTPWTSEGQHVYRQESGRAYGDPTVITTTWTWKLTIEPDGGQKEWHVSDPEASEFRQISRTMADKPRVSWPRQQTLLPPWGCAGARSTCARAR